MNKFKAGDAVGWRSHWGEDVTWVVGVIKNVNQGSDGTWFYDVREDATGMMWAGDESAFQLLIPEIEPKYTPEQIIAKFKEAQ